MDLKKKGKSLRTAAALVIVAGFCAYPCGPARAQTASTKFSVESPNAGEQGYVLGAGDVVMVTALNIDELQGNDLKPSTIDIRGNIDVPLIGTTRAAGLTVDELQSDLNKRLSAYVLVPKTNVTVVEYRSQPVSVLGSVTTPGIYYLTGSSNTLEQLLSKAGGMRQDAGNSINITRRSEMGQIPLPSDATDPSGKFNTATVPAHALFAAHDPQSNIVIKPQDVISIPKADLVYVVGSVNKPGGFILDEKPNMTVLQAVSMAEGLTRTSAAQKARILRQQPDGSHAEIPVDLNKILAGKSPDVPMFGRDVLFVPNSKMKSAAYRGAEAAISTGTGLAIFR